MHVGVDNYPAGMEVSTIVIANIHMLCVSFYDSSCDVTKCTLIVSIDRERRCIFAVYILVELEQPVPFTGAMGAGDIFGFKSWHSDEILLSQLAWDSSVAEKEYITSLRFAVGTIIGPIRVHVASEFIIAVSAAAAAAKVQSKVGCGFEILKDSFGGGEMAGEREGIVSAKCSNCEWDIRPSCKCCIHQWADDCLVAFDVI
jgi:hypothetical protein